jgi:hypothetical protein
MKKDPRKSKKGKKYDEESFLIELEWVEKAANSLDTVLPPPIVQVIIEEIERRGLSKLEGIKDLVLFLENYPKEKYEADIVPILIQAIRNIE